MIAALLLLADVVAPPPVIPVARGVFADDRVTAPDARLVWPTGTRVRVEERDGEIVARFDRPLSDERIAAFRDAAGAAVGDLRWNDDSLVLRAAPGWTMRWRQAGAVVSIAFAPPRAEVAADVADDGGRDLALVAIEADAAAGYPGRARRAATALAARYPGDRRVARIVADTRAADGDLRGAARGYRAIDARDRAARRVIAAAPGVASIGVTARDGSDFSQIEGAARVDVALDDAVTLGGAVRHVASRVRQGATTRRAGRTVADATLGLVPAEAVRVQVVASSLIDDGVTGGGARLTAGSADAQLRATLLRHMPDFSTGPQALAGGYLSRAALGATYRVTPGLVAQADAGWNRYGVAGQAGAADTITASGGLDYLVRRQFPALGVSYRFEAEYVQSLRQAADGSAIVPLANRENHTLQALISGAAGDVQMTGLAGWTVDRFGGDGPTASVGIAAPIAIAWRVEGGGGVTSVARPGFSGRQLYARALLSYSLGDAR